MQTLAIKAPNTLALEKAREYCKNNPGWVPICDITSEDLYFDWNMLPKKVTQSWIDRYGHSAQAAWKENGAKIIRFPNGYINGEGNFYPCITDVPYGSGMMLIVKISTST